MTRTRRTIQKIFPTTGDVLYSNMGVPLLEVLQDGNEDAVNYVNRGVCPRVHAVCMCATICGTILTALEQIAWRAYTESDAEECYRDICENLHEQLMSYGLFPPEIPLPWPLWTRATVDGVTFENHPAECEEGCELIMKVSVLA